MLAAILYGVGLSQGRARLAAQKIEYDGQMQRLQAQVQAQVDVVKKQLAAAQNRTRLIQARASLDRTALDRTALDRTALDRTALDLERHNFGTANTHLQESAAMLGQVQGGGNLDMARLSALKENMAKTDINVTTDLEGQRKQMLDFARQLEALTPQPVARAAG